MKKLFAFILVLGSVSSFAGLTAATENKAQLEINAESIESCLEQRDETLKTLKSGNRIVTYYGACTLFNAGYVSPKYKAIIEVFKY